MNDESLLLLSVWEKLNPFMSASADKQEAAEALVTTLIELGYDIDTLYDVDGECPYLDRALTTVAARDEDDEEEEELF